MGHHDPHHNLDVRAQGASIVQMETNKLIPWLMLTSLLAGIALAMSIVTLVIYTQNYRELEREFRLVQNDYDDVKVALELRGIPPHPHLKGQSD